MFCAGGNAGEGVCVGDSGGPLIVTKGTSDLTAIVIGIVSNGVTVDGFCAVENYPGVFASVPAQLDWIKAESGIA